jgi:hypothetical protein
MLHVSLEDKSVVKFRKAFRPKPSEQQTEI